MSKSNGTSDNSGPGASRPRTVTVYDRLEEARARREKALSGKPEPEKEKPAALAAASQPRKREKGDGMAAVVSSLKKSTQNAEAAANATYASAPEPSQQKRKRRVAALVAIPALVGLAAVALPLATGDQDLASSNPPEVLELPSQGAESDSVVARATPPDDPTFAVDPGTVETASLEQKELVLRSESETVETDAVTAQDLSVAEPSSALESNSTAIIVAAPGDNNSSFVTESKNTETASLEANLETPATVEETAEITAESSGDSEAKPATQEINDVIVAGTEDGAFGSDDDNLETAALSSDGLDEIVIFRELRANTLSTIAPLAPAAAQRNAAAIGLVLTRPGAASHPKQVAAIDPSFALLPMSELSEIGRPPNVKDIPALGPEVAKTMITQVDGNDFDASLTSSVFASATADFAPKRAKALPLAFASSPSNSPNVQGLAQPRSNVLLLSDLELPKFKPPFELESVKVAALGPIEYAIGAVMGPSKPRAASVDSVITPQAPPNRNDSLLLGGLKDDDIKLVLQIPNKVGESRVAEYIEATEATGLAVDRIIRAPFTISGTNVRYYHDQDAEAAKFIAETIGGRARDFTNFRPTPDLGLIEIYAEGKSKPRPRVVTPRPTTQVARQAEPKRYRIIRITKPRRSFNPFRRNSDDDDNGGNQRVEVVTMTERPAPGTSIAELFASAVESGTDSSTETGGDDDNSSGGGTVDNTGATGGNTGGTGAGGDTDGTDNSTGGGGNTTDDGSTSSGGTTGGSSGGNSDTDGATGGGASGGTATGGGAGSTGGTTTGGGTSGGSTSGGGSSSGGTAGGGTTGGDTSGGGTSGGGSSGGTTGGGTTSGGGSSSGGTSGGSTSGGGSSGGSTGGGGGSSGADTSGGSSSGGSTAGGGSDGGSSVSGG